MNVLEIEALSVSFLGYGSGTGRVSTNVIERLDLTIAQGEIVAVVGASGSGKSLLAHAIMGILPRNATYSGMIRLNGTQLDKKEWSRVRGRTLSFLPQSVGYLNPLLSVGHQLKGPFDRTESMSARRGILSRLGLTTAVEKLYPFQLSGGMTRKLLLAMSSQREANLIIADEPTPGMGADDVSETLKHFSELSQEGASVLMITHDLVSAATIAHRIVVLKDGAVVEIAPAGSFSGDGSLLKHPYSRALWQALPMNGFGIAVPKEAVANGAR
ncbi:ATP-binding cassette domain-containing protein [Paenibacillus sp. strain BS8-2]